MALKRPYDLEVPTEGSTGDSFKHQRLAENSDRASLQLHDISSVADDQGHRILGDGPSKKTDFDAEGKLVNGSIAENWEHTEEESLNAFPRSLSLSPWAARNASDDELTTNVAFWPFVPEYFSFDHSARRFIHVEDTYHLLLDCPPRKQVPIGPDHQAEIPDLQNDSKGVSKDDDSSHLAGSCVIPLPEAELPGDNGVQVGDGRNDCGCLDQSSLRCVLQHVVEARQKLCSSLGSQAFSELGFHDMGEVVAEKWTEDDEHVFHEVVTSNPVSLGKNFWNVLPFVFPSRTKKEIVSYYFNVFMHRKRAEQNRISPMHIDSDDDEWQAREDDDGNDEGGMTEDDGDSVVDSPVCHCGFSHCAICLPENNDDADEVCDDDDDYPVFVPHKDLANQGDSDLRFQPHSKTSSDEAGENDNQDGSCTSSDSGAPVQQGQGNPDTSERWREFPLEPCDSKGWDAYLSNPKDKMDLLPTISMIEEVFGDGAFDSQGKRG